MAKPRKKTEMAVLQAAVEWWDGCLPCDWLIVDHLDNPTINCTTEREHELAIAVSRLVRERRR